MDKIYKAKLNKGILQRSNFFSIHIINQLPEEVILAKTFTSFHKSR